MKRLSSVPVFVLALATVCASEFARAQQEGAVLSAGIDRKGVIEFATPDGKIRRSFLPEFCVLYRPDDPGLGQNYPIV